MKYPFDQASYHNILEAIFQRFPSVQTATFKDAYKPGLEGMMRFDAELGHPHTHFKTIHVAGTNGKGSVANMLAASLMGAGYKVGLYTSPHLIDFRERMRIDGKMIPKETVYDFFMEWKERFDELDLSFFEITTGMAFKWFAEENVDIAVIETGLGGRLDSTNIITPLLSIITSIGLDHCQLLGDTLAKIAGEKAGIIKKGVPALIGEIHEETLPVFEQKAEEMDSPLYFAPGMVPRFWERRSELVDTLLHGEYQNINLRTVLSALEILDRAGLDIYDSDEPGHTPGQRSRRVLHELQQAQTTMNFHGRWEFLCKDPYVLCDIGHNAHALRHNFGQLQEMIQSKKFSSLTLVFGIMADKDLDSVLPLMPENATWIFTQAQTRRAMDSTLLARRFEEAHPHHGKLFDIHSIDEAVKKALELAAAESRRPTGNSDEASLPLIYIGGSNFVVSEAFPLFKKE